MGNLSANNPLYKISYREVCLVSENVQFPFEYKIVTFFTVSYFQKFMKKKKVVFTVFDTNLRKHETK